MDGSPSRGETIPIRLFLGGFDLTPTFREVNKKYSTRYYLSLVLIDEGMILRINTSSTALMSSRCPKIFQAIRNCSLPPATRDCSSGRPADPDHRGTRSTSTTASIGSVIKGSISMWKFVS